MAGMASLVITDDTMTVQMSLAEKAEALHRDLTVPRSAVTGVRVVGDGLAEVHGLRLPGRTSQAVIMVGTWVSSEGRTFAVCHGRGPAIVIELAGQHVARQQVDRRQPRGTGRAAPGAAPPAAGRGLAAGGIAAPLSPPSPPGSGGVPTVRP